MQEQPHEGLGRALHFSGGGQKTGLDFAQGRVGGAENAGRQPVDTEVLAKVVHGLAVPLLELCLEAEVLGELGVRGQAGKGVSERLVRSEQRVVKWSLVVL